MNAFFEIDDEKISLFVKCLCGTDFHAIGVLTGERRQYSQFVSSALATASYGAMQALGGG